MTAALAFHWAVAAGEKNVAGSAVLCLIELATVVGMTVGPRASCLCRTFVVARWIWGHAAGLLSLWIRMASQLLLIICHMRGGVVLVRVVDCVIGRDACLLAIWWHRNQDFKLAYGNIRSRTNVRLKSMTICGDTIFLADITNNTSLPAPEAIRLEAWGERPASVQLEAARWRCRKTTQPTMSKSVTLFNQVKFPGCIVPEAGVGSTAEVQDNQRQRTRECAF